MTDFTFRRFTGFGSCAISSHPRASSLHVLLCSAVCSSHLLVHCYPAVVLVRYAKTVFHPLAFGSGRLSVVRRFYPASGRSDARFLSLYVQALPFRIPHLGEVLFSGLHASPENQSHACACAWPAPQLKLPFAAVALSALLLPVTRISLPFGAAIQFSWPYEASCLVCVSDALAPTGFDSPCTSTGTRSITGARLRPLHHEWRSLTIFTLAAAVSSVHLILYSSTHLHCCRGAGLPRCYRGSFTTRF